MMFTKNSKEIFEGLSQVQRLQAYLEVMGRINPLQAWTDLGIYRLSARIFDLRKTHEIEKQEITVTNQFGEKCKVANNKRTS